MVNPKLRWLTTVCDICEVITCFMDLSTSLMSILLDQLKARGSPDPTKKMCIKMLEML